jgi:hypothetical protein
MVCVRHKKQLKELGFTDQLGKNWEPWMALREFGCNALDDKGEFFSVGEHQTSPGYVEAIGANAWPGPAEGETTIIVEWDKMDEAYKTVGQIFFGHSDRPVVLKTAKVEVAEGRSSHVFYRGIRALKLERPSHFTYNILSTQALTEDRTIMHDWNVKQAVRDLWVQCTEIDLIRKALIDGDDFSSFENDLDYHNYPSYGDPPSRAFMDLGYECSSKRTKGWSSNAAALWSKTIRKDNESYYGGGSRARDDAFGMTLEAIREMFSCMVLNKDSGADDDFLDDPLHLDSAQFITLPPEQMPAGRDQLSAYEDGRSYISTKLLRQPKRVIAEHIIRLQFMGHYLDPMDVLLPVVLQDHSMTRKQRYGGDDVAPEPQTLDADDDPSIEGEPANPHDDPVLPSALDYEIPY